MNFKLPIALFGIIVLMLSSCSKEEEPYIPPPPPPTKHEAVIILNFNVTGGGMPLEYKKAFSDPLSRAINVEFLKYYLSNVSLYKGTVSENVLPVALISHFDGSIPDPSALKSKVYISVDTGNYIGLNLGIGLDAKTNASDPNDPSFPVDHPLSFNQSTHWGQWSKYKFIMMEGKWDKFSSGAPSTFYGYHTGFDEFYREKYFTQNWKLSKNDTVQIDFSFEYNEIFFGKDTLDMAIDPTWHGTDTNYLEPAKAISDNFIEALKIVKIQ